MRIFAAGGSGTIGRRLVPQLVEAGHEVAAMTRDQGKAPTLRELGAAPGVCDVFDQNQLKQELRRLEPDVVIHQLTDLPQRMKPRKLKHHYRANDRVRREGTSNLLAAARSAGVRRVIAQSVAFWYAPQEGTSLRTEGDPLYTTAPEPIGAAVRTMEFVERAVLEGVDLEGVVLRYGFFYGPGTWYSRDGDVGSQVRKKRYPIIGSGNGVFSFVHIDDAAAATVAALTAPPGAYNVVDDEPAAMSVWLPAFAEALEVPKPPRVPKAIAKLAAGRGPVSWLETLQGADNRHAKQVLDWRPRFPSWRAGFHDGLA